MKMRSLRRFSSPGLLLALAVTASCASAGPRSAAPASQKAADPHSAVASLAARIRAADYAADRRALTKLFEEMAPYTAGPLASRAYYWRGFAMWRRALNGFNDNADKAELGEELKRCIDDFAQASGAEPHFVDARVGETSCWGNLAFVSEGEERGQRFRRYIQLLGEVQNEAPGNPRLAWVLGVARWYPPPERGGGQAKAFEIYRAGLEAAKKEKVADELDPA